LDDGWGACRVKALADLEEAPPAPVEEESPASNSTIDTTPIAENRTESMQDGCLAEWVKTNFFT